MALNKGRGGGGGLVVSRRDSRLGSIPASTNWVVVLKPHELTDIKPPTPGDKLLAFLLCHHQAFNTISKTSMSSWFSGKCCSAAVGIGFLTLKVLFGADLIDFWIKDNSDFNPNRFDAVPLKMKTYNSAVLRENSTEWILLSAGKSVFTTLIMCVNGSAKEKFLIAVFSCLRI